MILLQRLRFLLSFLLSMTMVGAQFGVPRQKQGEAEVNIEGEQGSTSSSSKDNIVNPQTSDFEILMADKLLTINPDLKESMALDLALMLKFASTDPETSLLLRRLKDGTGKDELEALKADLTPKQVVEHLVQALTDLKMTEALFEKGPEKALDAMKKEGVLPKDKIKQYEKDPSLLEQDTRKSLYFSFVSLGAAGGFL